MGKQISIFDNEFQGCNYVIDASSILAQKSNDKHPRFIHKSMWDDIDDLIREGVIAIPRDILNEIDDEDIKNHLISLSPSVIEVDEDIQRNVQAVVKKCPGLIDFAKVKSSGDAFLIATAMKYGLTIITEENNQSLKKIPMVAQSLNVNCINILKLCEENDWSY